MSYFSLSFWCVDLELAVLWNSLNKWFHRNFRYSNHVIIWTLLTTHHLSLNWCVVIENNYLETFSFEICDCSCIKNYLIWECVIKLRTHTCTILWIPIIKCVELVKEEWSYLSNACVGYLQILATNYCNGYDFLLSLERSSCRVNCNSFCHVIDLCPLSVVTPGFLNWSSQTHFVLYNTDRLIWLTLENGIVLI